MNDPFKTFDDHIQKEKFELDALQYNLKSVGAALDHIRKIVVRAF